MKNKFRKLISSILIIAFLVSAFSLLVSAETVTGEAVDTSEVELLINRNFDEGWDYTNGFTGGNEKGNSFYIDYEQTSDYGYNYFLRAEGASALEGFLIFNFTSYVQKTNGTVIKMSLKADDVCNVSGLNDEIGRIFYGLSATKQTVNLLAIKNSMLCVYTDAEGTTVEPIAPLTNEWLDLAFVFDWDQSSFYLTVYYGENYEQSMVVTYPYASAGDTGFTSVRIALPAAGTDIAAENRMGASYCLDNFQIYQNTKSILTNSTVDSLGFGELINRLAEKTILIQSGTEKTAAQLLEEALCMKIGVDYALFKNKKTPIFDGTYGAPSVIDGNVMVPLELILDYIGFPYYVHADKLSYDITTGTSKTNLIAGRDSASVDGERVELTVAPGFITEGDKSYLVIALDDVEKLFPGWLVTYDSMGLIIVYEDLTPENLDDNKEIVGRTENLTVMVDLMKKFVFDTVVEDENGNTLKADAAYNATANEIYNDVKKNTNNFAHPYIGANQATFDKLNKVYSAVAGTEHYNEAAKAYLATLVGEAEAFYNQVADLNENGSYNSIKESEIPVNVYSDNRNPNSTDPSDKTVADTPDGYDPLGGRLDEIGKFAEKIRILAFAYQATRDVKYAQLAYDWSLALGEWVHWGPAYFTDCAEAAYAFSVGYDWLYNIYKELYGQDGVDAIARIIFENGVHEGYISSSGKTCEHARSKGDESRYSTLTTNVNAVCSSAMVTACLAIMDYDEYAEERNYLLGNNIINLANYGLDQYAPDGSYMESATYWAYGTNYFFRMVMSLVSAAGTDYGFMDTWGIDRTCYYAAQIESSDGNIWNYNDGGFDGISGALASQDTSLFFFAGTMLGDSNLLAIRQHHLTGFAKPKAVTICDMLYYPFDGVSVDAELSLDYYMEGIDAFVSRSSWEEGAMYTGIMGGVNNGSHAQIDSGNFIYHNKGIVWFMDLGSDDYNASGYLGASRNTYYRVNAEGQNVVCLVSDPTNIKYGQYTQAGGIITSTYSDEYGSYAIIDNTSVYLDSAVFARRGIFVTNDRNTVVVQDEITFKMIEDVYWIAHTAQRIEIDSSKRVAYLTGTNENGERYTLRATLVARTRAFLFSQVSANQPILESTVSSEDVLKKGGVPEYSRNQISRLVIEGSKVLSFNVAVAFEIITGDRETAPEVGYEWTSMGAWQPYPTAEAGSDINQPRETPTDPNVVQTLTMKAETIYEDETAFSENITQFFRYLCQVRYTIDFYGSDLPPSLIDYYDLYGDLEDAYEEFTDIVNESIESTHQIVGKLRGEISEE